MNFVILAEEQAAALELIACAKTLEAQSIEAVVFDEGAATGIAGSGIDQVTVAHIADGGMRESVAGVVAQKAQGLGKAVVLATTSRRMLATAAAVATQLETSVIVDAMGLSDNGAKHLLYGGKLVVEDLSRDGFMVVCVNRGVCEPAAIASEPCDIVTVDIPAASGTRVVGHREKAGQSVDLTASKRIVVIGRGVENQEDFALCEALAKATGSDIGCTRPVVETEEPLMPHDTYIGSSGLFVKPDLCFEIAISGQTQHTMGMMDSGIVVSINKDPNALIMRKSDYAIVGDYHVVLPAVTAALKT